MRADSVVDAVEDIAASDEEQTAMLCQTAESITTLEDRLERL